MIASRNRRQARQWKSFTLACAVSWAGLAGAADTASLGVIFSDLDGVAATACDGQFALELSFEPDVPGLDSDWWLVQVTPASELLSFDLDSWNCEPGLSPSYQGPGFALSQLSIEPECTLPAGANRFYFGVDGERNGSVDFDRLAFDVQPIKVVAPGGRARRLSQAATWMYQIQGLDEDGAVDALAATSYPLLVLEPGHNFTEFPYDTADMVSALRANPAGGSRLLLAYVDIGQAEDYRDYWGVDWVAPTQTSAGSPDFLVSLDPDGWSGNYPTAYWRAEWKALWLGEDGIVAQLARLGFDGIYLDWVEAYDDDAVRRAAGDDDVVPETEMIRFIEQLGEAGRQIVPDFLVVPQNAPYLLDSNPDRYIAAIDGLAVEDTWFHGLGDAEWDDPGAGDLHYRHEDEWSTANRLLQYARYQAAAIPVLSVDYCVDEDNAASVYRDARLAGLRPLVTRVALSQMTETPPGNF